MTVQETGGTRRGGLHRGAVAVMAMIATALTVAQQAQSQPARRYALLIGVTEFIAPSMAKHNLQGPANDVALVRTVMAGPGFQIPTADIVSLAGLTSDASARPTRQNIDREFRRLADVARAGDQVLVFLAGHGTQQPADPDPQDEEPDGLDEVFLPADASGWDRSSNRITNGIVDDDIHLWTDAIRRKGAIVTVIVDACHSGTITRSGPDTRERGIPADEFVPAATLAAIRKGEGRSPSRGGPLRAFELSSAAGDIAALYAADVVEGTPELPMPDRNGPVHGLFTYTLTRVLLEQRGPLTYRELVRRVIDRYRAEGFAPTPVFEGVGIDRAVLGDRVVRERPAFAINARDGGNRWMVSAGSVHGLTDGSILEVLPPARSATAAPVGYVRIADVRPTSAIAVPIRFAGMAAPVAARVVPGSIARIRHHEFGALSIRVALQPSGPALTARALERALSSLSVLTQGLAERANSADADWLIDVVANRVVLAQGSRVGASRDNTAAQTVAKRFDVGAVDDAKLPDLLADRLRRIARAANLAHLSSVHVDAEANLDIEVLRYLKGATTGTSLLAAAIGPIVKAGDRVQFVIKNTGTVPLDITVLYVDADFGIQSLFPEANRELDNRLDPGGERRLETAQVTADPIGWESVIAIGVESTPRHENFALLAQDSIEEVRASSGPRSPLRTLLQTAVSGTRSGRVNPEDDFGRFAIAQTWLRVEPEER